MFRRIIHLTLQLNGVVLILTGNYICRQVQPDLHGVLFAGFVYAPPLELLHLFERVLGLQVSKHDSPQPLPQLNTHSN